MRRLLISLLLAGAAATPALAAPDDVPGRSEAREEREQSRSERREAREARQEARQDRSEPTVEFRARVSDGPARAGAVARAPRSDVETIRAVRQSEGQQLGGGETLQPRQQRLQSIRDERRAQMESRRDTRDQRIDEAQLNRQLRQSDRPLPRVLRNRVPVVSSTPREGTQPPPRLEARSHSTVTWSPSHWRKDRRYDWWSWRNRNRWLFNLGFYSDPFGWGYRPYYIGWRMWPSYYHSRFWLHDPWMYRLPYAPPGYRWIRYYDDAILIDTWDGRVVDVIYNFFW